jgi:hypothetical protein
MLYSASRLGPHDFGLNLSTFRKTALGLTAATAMAGASILTSFPANAQQAVNYISKTPDCSAVDEPAKRAICESFQRTEDAKRRGAEADKRGAAEDVLRDCLLTLTAFKKSSPDRFAELGPINRDTACLAAARVRKLSGEPKPLG